MVSSLPESGARGRERPWASPAPGQVCSRSAVRPGPLPAQLPCARSRRALQLSAPGAWSPNVQARGVQQAHGTGTDREAPGGARPGLALWRSPQARSGSVSPATLLLTGPPGGHQDLLSHRDPIRSGRTSALCAPLLSPGPRGSSPSSGGPSPVLPGEAPPTRLGSGALPCPVGMGSGVGTCGGPGPLSHKGLWG